MLDDKAASCIDSAFQNRWRTLMSVDDLIDAVFRLTDELGITEETYFLYSSE